MSGTMVIRYADALGRAGKLKGEITFTDGRTCKVWDDEMHAQCKALAAEKVTPVTYAFKTCEKWGHSLTAISRAAEYADAYEAARLEDEQRGRIAPNSWLGRQIRDGVGKIDDFDQERR